MSRSFPIILFGVGITLAGSAQAQVLGPRQ